MKEHTEITKDNIHQVLQNARDSFNNLDCPEPEPIGSKENPLIVHKSMIEPFKKIYPHVEFVVPSLDGE